MVRGGPFGPAATCLTKGKPAGCLGRFMTILTVVLTFLLVLVSLFLGLLVLVQKPRSDSGLGTAMGGGVAEATFGAETGNVLTRSTIVLAVAFFVLALGAYLGQLYIFKHKDVSAETLPTAPITAPATTPAPEQPAPAPANPAPTTNP
jgi:preprotein translocase subunit SecG